MNRSLSLLAWFLGAGAIVLVALELHLVALNHLRHPQDALYSLGFVVFAVVGAFIAAHRPQNAIGWLFCVVGLSNVLSSCAMQYAVFTLRTDPGSLPAGTPAAWLGMGWIASIGWGSMALFIPLLFPTGRLLTPRWRVVAVLAGFALGLQVGFQMVLPGPVDSQYLPAVRNPLAIGAVAAFGDVAQGAVMSLVVVTMAAGVVSLLLRFRRVGVEERLQIKWFAYSAVVLAALIALAIVNSAVVNNPLFNRLSDPLFVIAVSVLPISAAVAILRHRLYDIDVLINRTLVYGSLTLSLAGLYIGGVIAVQAIFRSMTGQNSDLAIAIVTLAIAALFNPWRRRLQVFIDRRFYRRKYDASRILTAFTSQLRDDVDLDRLAANLARIVHDTVEPAHVSLWLPPEASQ